MRVKQKKMFIGISILILATLVFAGCTTNQEKKIGKIDINKVIKESPEAQKIQNKLDDESKRIREKYNFDEEGEESLTDEEKKSNQEKAIQEFVQIKKELEEELNEKIEAAVEETVEEENLDIVLHKESVRYGGIDITQKVLEKLQ